MGDAKYRAGIIGLGFIGAADQVSGDALGQQVGHLDGTHSDALAGHGGIELVAGSSRDPGRRERFAARSGARTYADWQDLLAAEELDIVSVATYAPVHAEITVACAERGVSVVYCEKPIATRLVDADHMVAACKAAGTLLVINHQRHFNPNYRALRDLVAAGGLGELTSVSLQWPAGRLGNVGTHMIDALCLVTSRQVRAVSGTLDLAGKPDCRGEEFSDPGGWGVMRLDGGLMVTVDAADYATVPASLVVNGTGGRARAGGEEVTVEFPDGRCDVWSSRRPAATGMDVAVAEITAWLDDRTPFPYPAEEALHAFEAVVGFHASHASRAAWTELPLTGPDREREVQSG